MKRLRQTFDVCAPGDLGRSAILAAVEQYEIRSVARLHKVGFDVAGDDVSMVIRSHVRKISFGSQIEQNLFFLSMNSVMTLQYGNVTAKSPDAATRRATPL